MINPPQISAKIGDIELLILIDTGANISVISEEFFKRLVTEAKVEFLPVVNVCCKTAIGQKKERIKYQTLLEGNSGEWKFQIICLVVPRLTREVILGNDILYEYQAELDFRRHEMRVYKNDKLIRVNFMRERFSELMRDNDGFINERFFVEDLIDDEDNDLYCEEDNTDQDDYFYADKESVYEGGTRADHEIRLEGNDLEARRRNSLDNENEICQSSFEIKITQAFDLDETQRDMLLSCLKQNAKVFSSNPGKCRVYKHKFTVTGIVPFNHKSRPIPNSIRSQAEKIIQDMVRDDVIEISNSVYIHPLCWVHKSDGTLRMTLDARKVNSYTTPDYFKPLGVEEILGKLRNAKYFSKIDLTASYWQIVLDEDVRKYVGFSFMGRVYQFKRCAFGLSTSGSALLRALDIIFENSIKDFALHYVDDFLIYDNDFNMHIEHINFILGKFYDSGMTVNLQKSIFFSQEIQFLGYVITPQGIRPSVERVAAVEKIPPPKTLRQLRRFLGILQYESKFIINYAKELIPLRELLKKGQRWDWTEERQKAFENVKLLFRNAILLEIPDPDGIYYIFTDASIKYYGAVLTQIDSYGERHIIATASKALNSVESNACVSEQEVAAIYFALQKFRQYVYGRKIVVYTDHLSLAFMQKCKLTSSKLSRYIHEITSYQIEVRHIPGKENIFSDLLSRQHLEEGIPETLSRPQREVVLMNLNVWNCKELNDKIKNLGTLQDSDEILKDLKISAPVLSETSLSKLAVKDNVLYKLHGHPIKKWKMVIPKMLETELINSFHHRLAHPGCERTSLAIESLFYVKHLRQKARKIISTCELCQKAKPLNVKFDVEPQVIVRDKRNALISIDAHGELPASKFGCKYIFVMYDVFTKFVKIYPVRNIKSKTCLNKITSHWIPEFGKMEAIISDNATVHKSKLFTETLEELDIKLYNSSAYHPQSNPCERIIRDIGMHMRILCHKNHKGWYNSCQVIEDVINHIPSPSTGFTPYELMTGKPPQKLLIKSSTTVDKPDEKLTEEEKCRLAYQKLIKKSEIRKKKAKRSKRTWKPEIGDLVLVRNFCLSSAQRKLYRRMNLLYKGPYIIQNIFGKQTYEVTDKSDKIIGRFHISLLKPYHSEVETS